VKGEGNQQDYGMRIYDPRVGRFLSVDPLTKQYPHYTPYSFAGNKPTVFIDRDGEEESLDFRLRRYEEAYLNNEITEDQYRERVRAMGTTGTIAGLVVADVFLTKGRLSTFVGSTLFGDRLIIKRPKLQKGEKSKISVPMLAFWAQLVDGH